mmetsp:Transcript_22315/g.60952  ORF Transcript_22315/g.60952 Transcript_22315/m.60952 type:complete len:124 (+) Transcript_22315:111-482(+)
MCSTSATHSPNIPKEFERVPAPMLGDQGSTLPLGLAPPSLGASERMAMSFTFTMRSPIIVPFPPPLCGRGGAGGDQTQILANVGREGLTPAISSEMWVGKIARPRFSLLAPRAHSPIMWRQCT